MPATLLPRAEVERRCGISRSTIYQRMAENRFPQVIRDLDSPSVWWLESEVDGWIQARLSTTLVELGGNSGGSPGWSVARFRAVWSFPPGFGCRVPHHRSSPAFVSTPLSRLLRLRHYIDAAALKPWFNDGIGRHDGPLFIRFQVSRMIASLRGQSSRCHSGTLRS